jgi:SAM-dependent methyltransferase
VQSCCAGFYELPVVSMLLGDNLHPGGAALTRRLAELTIVGRDTGVLDVACGRGESARVLAGHCGCRVVGLDRSRINATRAHELTQEAGLAGSVRFVTGDAESLPFPDDSFAVVISECSLCLVPDLEQSLIEIRRVMRPGGHVGISDIVLNAPVPASLQNLLGHVLCISGARPTHGYHQALKAAGLGGIRTRDVSYVLTEMVTRIERRIRTLDDLLDPDQLRQVEGLGDPAPKLAAARESIRSGAIGYALFTARKPRAGLTNQDSGSSRGREES